MPSPFRAAVLLVALGVSVPTHGQPATASPGNRAKAGAPEAPRAADLKAIEARLTQVQAEAARLRGEQRTVLGRLRQLELAAEGRALERARTTARMAAMTTAIAAAETRVAAADARLAALAPQIRARLVRLYKLMPLGYDRLLFSVEDARTFDRAARVVTVLARRDRDELEGFQRLRAARAADVATLVRERAALEAGRRQLAAEEEALVETVAEQQRVLRSLRERRDMAAQLVDELSAARDRLDQSIQALSTSGPRVSLTSGLRLRPGTMAWPVPGRIESRFGRHPSSRFGTMVTRNGVDIGADADAPVRAVQSGTVAFADTFTGFGRVVILDHGGKAYTLYGHLAAINVTKGAAVDAGAELGRVGTAPAGNASLYFEVRVDGRPVDPVQWLKRD